MGRNKILIVLVLASGLAWPTVSQAEDEPEGWTGDVNLSVAAGSGTTSTFAGNFDAKTERSFGKDKVGVRLNATLGTSKPRKERTETTQDSQALTGSWKRIIHERFFWNSGTEVSRDNVQDRELRALVKTGPGYRFWQGDGDGKEHFDVSAGMGYRHEIYDGNLAHTPGGESVQGESFNFADAVAGFDYKKRLFDDKIDFSHTADVALPMNDTKAFIVTTEVIVGIPLSKAWSVRFATLVQYTNFVEDDIEKLRTTTTVGLGYKF